MSIAAMSKADILSAARAAIPKVKYWVKYTTGRRVTVEIFGRKVKQWHDQEEQLIGPLSYHKQAEQHIIDVLGNRSTVPGTAEVIEGEPY